MRRSPHDHPSFDLFRRKAERHFEEALEHGLAAEELAPHQVEVSTFVTDALTVLGRIDELQERLRKEQTAAQDKKRAEAANAPAGEGGVK